MAQQLGSFEKVLRVGEGRRVKRLAEQAAYIGTLEPEFEALATPSSPAKTAEFKQRLENGEALEELALRGVRRRPRGVQAHDGRSASSTSS